MTFDFGIFFVDLHPPPIVVLFVRACKRLLPLVYALLLDNHLVECFLFIDRVLQNLADLKQLTFFLFALDHGLLKLSIERCYFLYVLISNGCLSIFTLLLHRVELTSSFIHHFEGKLALRLEGGITSDLLFQFSLQLCILVFQVVERNLQATRRSFKSHLLALQLILKLCDECVVFQFTQLLLEKIYLDCLVVTLSLQDNILLY